MTDSVALIKDTLSIVDLVGETFTVVKSGAAVWTTHEHDSLKLWPKTQSWYWFSRGLGGDIFDWYQLIQRCNFREALEALAGKARVELAPLSAEQRQAVDAQRKREQVFGLAAAYFAAAARAPRAREYCGRRGWSVETMEAFRLGYSTRQAEQTPLAGVLRDAGVLEEPTARAVLSIPEDYLVYPHMRGGRVVYLSARSVEGKRHYNLPLELAGPRQVFEAWPVGPATREIHVLVEGQADAISLAQVGVRATALCGVKGQATPGVTHVALDNDRSGQAGNLEMALGHGPLTALVKWPMGMKDANELLRAEDGPTRMMACLDAGMPAIIALAGHSNTQRGEERQAAIRRLGTAFHTLDELTQADMGEEIAQALGVKISHFKRLMRATDEEEAKEQPSPSQYVTSAGGVVGQVVFEQCVTWDEAGSVTCAYAVRQADGKIAMQATVDVGDTTFVPFPGTIDLIRKRVVLFPAGVSEFGSQRALLGEIRAFIHRWLDIDTFYEQLASYYIMFTWLYDLFETLPYLRALGDYGTGKSRFLQTIGVLCYRPMFVSGASTASPIFRVIDMFRGTLVIDEADFANSDAEAEIIKIVNVGYARGGVVLRSEKDQSSDSYYPSAKDVFCPKILATRRLFQDRATESRCLTKRMSTAKPRAEIPRLLSRAFWAEAEGLRNRLLLYRLRCYRPMDIDPALSDFSIEPRLDQVTLALKSIIDDQEMRDQINVFVRAYNGTLISDRQMSVPAVVVSVLADVWYRPALTLTGEMRDWTIKGLSDRVKTALEAIDPDEKMNPRRLSSILSEDLGLTSRGQDKESRRATLVLSEDALHALMNRYGVDIPG